MRGLLIDDDEVYTRVLRTSLLRHGHEVHIAHDSVTALATATASVPDYALVDLKLGDESGLELVDVTLFANGAWQVRATLRPASPELAAALRAAGFQETPLGYVRTEQGGDAR